MVKNQCLLSAKTKINNMKKYDLIIIGGGPAGMAAALEAYKNQVKSILLLERDNELGGILNQCIHAGFGVNDFGKELTGTEYSNLFIEKIKKTNIDILLNTSVLKIYSNNSDNGDNNKIILAINSESGLINFTAKAVILATGCREKTRGVMGVYGTRPAGIYTAGVAQRLINIDGLMPGNEIVIFGPGIVGLVMAERMILEGAKIKAIFDGVQVISKIHGRDRVEGVSVYEEGGAEKFIACDTVLLAAGFLPENALACAAGIVMDKDTFGPVVGKLMQTNVAGIFACGNAVRIHDLVDFVAKEGELAGLGAAHYINNIVTVNFNKINTNISQKNINKVETKKIICTCCPINCNLKVEYNNGEIVAIEGNKCSKGKKYAQEELAGAKSIITTTIKITGADYPVISVKTTQAVPQEKIFTIMKILATVETVAPISIGEVILQNIANTGADVIATKTVALRRDVRAAEGA
jgi:CxxC motif-containing protein/thioredoxin reductase